MDLRSAFGKRVRALRTEKGLSQEQLAERADVHWTYISGIERGQRSPTLNVLGRLATALQTPLPDLVSDISSNPGKPGKLTRRR